MGAVPVFVDIDPDTFNMSVEKLETAVREFKNSSQAGLVPRAVIPVDLFGLPCDYDRINQIAKDNGLVVIEDGAQSFGAAYKGRRAGGLGDIGCTSFFPAKPLGCYGDGGAVFTNSDEMAETLVSIYDGVRLRLRVTGYCGYWGIK